MGKLEPRPDGELRKDEDVAPQVDFGELAEEERKALLDEVDEPSEDGPVDTSGDRRAAGADAEPEAAELDELLDERGASATEASGIAPEAGRDRLAESSAGEPASEADAGEPASEANAGERAPTAAGADALETDDTTPPPESVELDELRDAPKASEEHPVVDENSSRASPPEDPVRDEEDLRHDEPEAATADSQRDAPSDPEPPTDSRPHDATEGRPPEPASTADRDAEDAPPALDEGETTVAPSANGERGEQVEPVSARGRVSEPPPPPRRMSKGPSASATGTPLPHWSQRPLPHPPRPKDPAEMSDIERVEVSLPRDADLPGFDSIPAPLGGISEDSEPARESDPPAPARLQPAPTRSGAVAIAFLLGVILGMVVMRAFDVFEVPPSRVEAPPTVGEVAEEEPTLRADDAPVASSESQPALESRASQESESSSVEPQPVVAGPLPGPLPSSAEEPPSDEPDASTEPEAEAEPEAASLAPFDRDAAATALSAAAAQAAGCRAEGAPPGFSRVRVTFKNTGQATSALVVGPPYAGTPTGSCIARIMRTTTIPPFAGDAQTVSKTVQIR